MHRYIKSDCYSEVTIPVYKEVKVYIKLTSPGNNQPTSVSDIDAFPPPGELVFVLWAAMMTTLKKYAVLIQSVHFSSYFCITNFGNLFTLKLISVHNMPS